jgi:hypothetical protein
MLMLLPTQFRVERGILLRMDVTGISAGSVTEQQSARPYRGALQLGEIELCIARSMKRASHRRDTRKKFCHAMSRENVTGGIFNVNNLFQRRLSRAFNGFALRY